MSQAPSLLHLGRAGQSAAVALAALFMAVGLSAAPARAAQAAQAVPTAIAQPGSAAQASRLDGVLQPVRQATLAAQLGGTLLSLGVKAGDAVKAGQVIGRVDDRDAQAAVLQADAAVAQAQAALRQAQLQIERTRQLQGQGFVSQAALDQATAQFQTAQAGVNQASAARAQARLALGFATLKAPYDAVVLATLAEPGDLAAPGRAIVTVYVPGAVRAVVQVPASMAGSARAAQSVAVVLPDGRRLVPVQSQLLPTADAVSQTVEWRLDLPGGSGAAPLRPGEAVQVQWQSPPQAQPPAAPEAGAVAATGRSGAALSVPASAVLQRGELTAMYVVQDQRFVLRAVRTGARTGDQVPVLAGLRANERYAVDAIAAGLADAVPAP